MNSVEKGKIEKIITAEVEERVEEIEEKRKQEFEALKEKCEKTPSKDVLDARELLSLNKKKRNELEKHLKDLGFSLGYEDKLVLDSKHRYENGSSFYEYSIPELTEHSKETALKVRSIKKLSRLYQLKLYAGNDEEQKEVLQFVNDFDTAIEKMITEL